MTSDPQGVAQRQEWLLRKPIDGQVFKPLINAGLTWLRTNQEIVNALNVFPVPDGDTGTNMVLTMQAAYDEIINSPERNFGKMAHTVAHGALMGARGNSGVILSQIWRGFARACGNIEILDAPTFVKAFSEARDTAYKGVVRPVEGTILTVTKDIATAAKEALNETDNPITILDQVIIAADQSVERTPELLDILRDAGVVDAGGKGLHIILEGMLRYINGQALDEALTAVSPLSEMMLSHTLESVEPGQDFEVIVDFHPNNPLDIEVFYGDLEQMGTSIQVGEGDGIYRLHIHVPTDNLYSPITYTRSLGVVTKVAIENLIAQMEADEHRCGDEMPSFTSIEPGQIAVVAVTPGIGIARVFASLGVAAIVEGGQTMNPSTQDFINSFERLSTDKIIILPNNKNIFMAAKAAAELTVKNVAVIPSRSIPQGLAALMRLMPEGDFDIVVEEMIQALDVVETGEITIANRTVELDGVRAKEGDVIALHNDKLVASASNLEDGCLEFLKKAHADHFEIITIFYGADVSKQEVFRIADVIRSVYPEQEVEVQEGCQPHYHFIFCIE